MSDWHAFGTTEGMSASARPELFAFMDAYKLLGVDYTADSSTINRAHRRLAKQHHPDKFAAGSPEQKQASGRMAAINDAFRLIRTAPLKYLRVSQPSYESTSWTDDELEAALHRARVDQEFDELMTVALLAAAVIFLLFLQYAMPTLERTSHAMPLMLVVGAGMGLVSTFVI